MNDNKTAYSGKDCPVHTNGPWRIECENVKTAISSGHKHIAMVSYFDCGTGDPRSISKEEYEANARLIAAAPDLYNALDTLAQAWESKGLPCDAARAALAKARGEE